MFNVNEAIDASFIGTWDPALITLFFGAVGGVAYLARQSLKQYAIRPAEWWARPFLGAVAAFVMVRGFGFPDHANSILIGLAGVGTLDLAVHVLETRVQAAWGAYVAKALPGWRHVSKEEIEKAIVERVDELKK